MKSIRTRLSAYLLLAAIITAAVIGVVTYQYTLKQNEDLFDYQLRQIALSLRDQGAITNPYAGTQEEGQDVVVQIWTSNGTMLYFSRPGDPLLDRATLGFTDVDAGNTRWRVFSMAANDRIIQVAQPLDLRRDLAAGAALRSLAPLLAFAPLMALLIWVTVGTSLLPLKRLARDVEQRDARSLERVSEQHLPDEIAPLAAALNALLERLKRAFSNQRAFVADAAHELRSPLTALKLQLQLLERSPDAAARAEALQKLHDGVDRASHLIEQLLAAARTDPNDRMATVQPLDVAEMLRRTIADLFVFAQASHVTVELDAPEHLTLEADAATLPILARNLLDNAIRYTPANGRVLATVQAQDECIDLIIEDSGPGIPEGERQRVFDRFFRGEGNRQSGSGLGLSIVKNIAEQHHAQVVLDRSRYGGLKVSVSFPLPTQREA